MTQEEKRLLEIELATRSQYGVICAIKPVVPFYDLGFCGKQKIKNISIRENDSIFTFGPYEVHGVENIKPYLRPMSSMTEEEKWEEQNTVMKFLQDFYNERHLDYRGLIEKGLALEATEGMYKTETTMKAQETIDRLEAEKPIEELEEEIKTRWNILNRAGNDIPFDTFNGIACHFAQWGAEHRGGSEIPKDLESYAQKVEDYYDVGEERGYLCVQRGEVKDAVIAGAQWHKEQMMKEAVEVRVQPSPLNGPLGISAYCCNFPSKHPFYHCKEGDNVKLVIIKED